MERLHKNTEPLMVLNANHNHEKGKQKNKDFFEGLEKKIYIKKGSRIMITNNLWCDAGIVNGATGTIM